MHCVKCAFVCKAYTACSGKRSALYKVDALQWADTYTYYDYYALFLQVSTLHSIHCAELFNSAVLL